MIKINMCVLHVQVAAWILCPAARSCMGNPIAPKMPLGTLDHETLEKLRSITNLGTVYYKDSGLDHGTLQS